MNEKQKFTIAPRRKIKLKTQRKVLKIDQIFQDFKKRYGQKQQNSVLKSKKKQMCNQSSLIELNNFNRTNLQYQKDISQIRYNMDVLQGQKKSSCQKWPALPQRMQINWQLLIQIEQKIQNWKK